MSVALTLPSKAGALGVSISSVGAMSAMTTHAPQHAGADMDCSTRFRSPGSDSGMIITPVPCAEHNVTGNCSACARAACASGIHAVASSNTVQIVFLKP